MIETVYIVRHGDRPWDLKNAPGAGGVPGNVPLTEHGEEQAQELADFLQKEVPSIDLILSSPYHRALQTVAPTAKRRGMKIAVEFGFQEHAWGKGFHPVLKDGPSVADAFELDPDYQSTFSFPAEVEAEEPLMTARISAAAEHCLKIVDQDPRYSHVKTVLISSHGGPIISLTRALTKDHASPMAVYTACTTKLHRSDQSRILGGFKSDYLAMTDYLSKGAESGWTF